LIGAIGGGASNLCFDFSLVFTASPVTGGGADALEEESHPARAATAATDRVKARSRRTLTGVYL